ncbi:MAG: dihydroorotate dehydrogenase-like protein [Bacteroidales bacterium]|nr:dihydroorotate dehydrogenase-like protein [Bacteroidales bacterium]
MTNISTTFAGLHLSNPIIISSSGLTKSADRIIKLAEAGAGAVVLKSLFEEQILAETGKALDENVYDHTEGYDYISTYVRQQKLDSYLNVIKESKKGCDIPVIASINCHNDAEWVNFAKEIEKAGADAIEINILSLQTTKASEYEYGAFEKEHVKILKHLKQTVKIPVIMKLGNSFTNPVALADQLKQNGADAVVLFNRFFPFDIDIENLSTSAGAILSDDCELSNPLRWAGIVSNAVKNLDIAVSGGVHDGAGIIKSLLAGAAATELCSVIFEKGASHIATMKHDMESWMEKHGYSSVTDFKGVLNAGSGRDNADLFERAQFIKHFGGKE